MLKGKTIQSNLNHISEVMNTSGIRNSSVMCEAPNPKTLVPRKIANDVSTVNHYYTNVTVEEVLKHIEQPTIKNLYYSKTINQTEISKENNIEKVQQNVNLRYSLQELKNMFPGFNNLYYIEIFDLLQTLDFNLTSENLNINLQKFIHLGNNIQSQISRLNETLNFVPSYSSKQLNEDFRKKWGFFTSDSEIEKLFDEYNDAALNYISSLYTELHNIKNLDFSKYNLVNLYFDFFKFIADELKNKNIASDENIGMSTIASRVISLNNSKTVLAQFKNLTTLEAQGIELELNNIKNYLDTLKPSLYLLQRQNFKQFKDKFKELLNK